jgi:lysophospholipase L1-like esterase
MSIKLQPLVPSRTASSIALALSPAAALVAAQARRVWRARTVAADAPATFSQLLPAARQRILLVGDSTGAGVGCERADESIAARLARDFAQAEVRNLCVNGATVAHVLQAVRGLGAAGFDLVLVFAGGNDVLRRTPCHELRRDTAALLDELGGRGAQVVWTGMANVGLAPLFLPPFSWWMTARTRRVNRLLATEAAAAGVRFVDFFRERGSDPFSADPARFYARDHVHPSGQAYAYCYARMRPAIQQALCGS